MRRRKAECLCHGSAGYMYWARADSPCVAQCAVGRTSTPALAISRDSVHCTECARTLVSDTTMPCAHRAWSPAGSYAPASRSARKILPTPPTADSCSAGAPHERATKLSTCPEACRATEAGIVLISPGRTALHGSHGGLARRRSYTRGSEVGDRCRPSLKP